MLYCCSACRKPAYVDHVNPPQKECICDAPIIAELDGTLEGRGGIKAETEQQEELVMHNLSETGLTILRSTIFALAGMEIFGNEKPGIFANDLRVKDNGTGREFSFTFVAKEIKHD